MKHFILFFLILLVGCSAERTTELVLTDDTAQNVKILKSHIPNGTPVDEAKQFMEQNGFGCAIHKKITKGSKKIGSTYYDFLFCNKQGKNLISRRWRVFFAIEDGKIIDCYSTTDLVLLYIFAL